MTYEIYRNIYIIGGILAGVLMAGAVVLFFVFRIPKIIGDLTGRNARKAISGIRMKNSTASLNKQGNTADMKKQKQNVITETLEREIRTGEETEVLSQSGEETMVLYPPEETVLLYTYEGTEAVSDEYTEQPVTAGRNISFTPDTDITFIHTDEVID